MATCTSCGNDVTGKKFCPECGTPVQAAVAPDGDVSMPVQAAPRWIDEAGTRLCKRSCRSAR